MITFNQNFYNRLAINIKSIRLAVKINNTTAPFWVVSHSDVTPNDALPVFNMLKNLETNGSTIEQEYGFASIGGGALNVLDNDNTFSQHLKTISDADDSLYFDKAQIYLGEEQLSFVDYEIQETLLVKSVDNSFDVYNLGLQDLQRLIKTNIAKPKNDTFVAVVDSGDNDVNLTFSTEMTDASPGKIKVGDSTKFERVEHDSYWQFDPSETVGYIKIKSVRASGQDSYEIFKFTGTDGVDPNILTGVVRSQFGTKPVKADKESEISIEEVVYIDLPTPKFLNAMMLGSLIDQPGQSLPSHWHLGLDSSLVDTASIQLIGEDVWQIRQQFIDLQESAAKDLIYGEVNSPSGCFFRINNNGEFSLTRYSKSIQNSPADIVVSKDEILDFSNLERRTNKLVNRFSFQWEWRPDLDRFRRYYLFVDGWSANKFKYTSPIKKWQLRGIRNTGRTQLTALANFAESVRNRTSVPFVNPTLTVPLRLGLGLELGDKVNVSVDDYPDFPLSSSELNATMEVVGINKKYLSNRVELSLFASSEPIKPIEFQIDGVGDVTRPVATIDTTNYTDITSYLPGGSFTDSGGTVTITQDVTITGSTLASSSAYFVCNGNLTVNSGITVTIEGETVVLYVTGDTNLSSATVDGKPTGASGGARRYFGGTDTANPGITVDGNGVVTQVISTSRVARSNTNVENLNLFVDENNVLQGLPTDTATGQHDDLGGSDGSDGPNSNVPGAPLDTVFGTLGGAGGTGFVLITRALFTDINTDIITSGGDVVRANTEVENGVTYYGAIGGAGYPGVFACLITDPSVPLPDLDGKHLGLVGGTTQKNAQTGESIVPDLDFRFGSFSSTGPAYTPSSGTTIGPNARFAQRYFDADLSESCRLIKYLGQEQVQDDVPGTDEIGDALGVTLSFTQLLNTPPTPAGNQGVITVNATPTPGDTFFSYAYIEYRLSDQPWYPLVYSNNTESSTSHLTMDGATYEFRATSYNTEGVAGAITEDSFTVSIISRTSGETDTSDPEVSIADPTNLRLSNSVGSSGGDLLDWKGSDAEFVWDKGSLSVGGDIIDPEDVIDYFHAGYKVWIRKQSDNSLLRERHVTDSNFIYTLEDNLLDTAGSPERQIRIEVQALANTGNHSNVITLDVENPATAAITNVQFSYSSGGVTVTYDPVVDQDFIGVRYDGQLYSGSSFQIPFPASRSETLDFISVDQFGDGATANIAYTKTVPAAVTGVVLEASLDTISGRFILPDDDYVVGTDLYFETGTPVDVYSTGTVSRINGNTFTLGGLSSDTTYTIGIKTVDQYGDGGQITQIGITTNTLDTGTLGLGPWATRTTPVDATFISSNMDNDSIASQQIISVAAGRIAAGNVEVGINLGDPLADAIVLDGTNGKIQALSGANGVEIEASTGLIKSVNSGYQATVGPISVPAESANPLIISANSGSTYAFWIDSAGNAELKNVTLTSASFVGATSGYSTLTDRPNNLSDINSGEGTKLTGIETGATQNTGALADKNTADYSTDVSGTKPPTDADNTETAIESTTSISSGGVFVDGANGGFYVGSQTFGASGIQIERDSSDAQAYIGDGSDDYIQYDVTNGWQLGPDVTNNSGLSWSKSKLFFYELAYEHNTVRANPVVGNVEYTYGTEGVKVRPDDNNVAATGYIAATIGSQSVILPSSGRFNPGTMDWRGKLSFKLKCNAAGNQPDYVWAGFGEDVDSVTASTTNSYVGLRIGLTSGGNMEIYAAIIDTGTVTLKTPVYSSGIANATGWFVLYVKKVGSSFTVSIHEDDFYTTAIRTWTFTDTLPDQETLLGSVSLTMQSTNSTRTNREVTLYDQMVQEL